MIYSRFEGSAALFPSNAENQHKANPKMADNFLEETEVITRIMFVLHKYSWDLEKFDWSAKFERNGIDSLEQVCLLTSIEEEFNTIFEDKLFEHFETLDEVKEHIVLDHNCF